MARNSLIGLGRNIVQAAALLIAITAEIKRAFSKASILLLAFYANRRQVRIR